ncbi:MAG: hypothetical protein ABEL04_10455 [Salinibacter sp.]|uniref:hypothetical protein n=1 Tax=Salinibacter sp. TaxID=2065818 RepID=UPI0035D50F1B
MSRVIALFVLPLLLTACASSENATSDESSSGATSDRIVVSDLSYPVSGLSVYDLIQRENSNWLRKRGSSSINNPVPIKVYVDNAGSPYGGIRSLRRLNAQNVATVEHFDAQEAQYKFGLGNVSGAILVRTRTGNK